MAKIILRPIMLNMYQHWLLASLVLTILLLFVQIITDNYIMEIQFYKVKLTGTLCLKLMKKFLPLKKF